MAWGRISRVVIKSPACLSGGSWTWTEVEIKDLEHQYSITRSRVFNDNSASINIFNASADTRNRILTRGSNVLVYGGYEDEGEGLLYQGSIIDSQSVHSGAEWITTLQAQSFRSLTHPFMDTPVAVKFAPGATADKVVDYLASQLGLVPVGLEMAKKVELPCGFIWVGSISGALQAIGQKLKFMGYQLFQDLGELVVYSLTAGDSTYTATYLSEDSGLLELKPTTDYVSTTKDVVSALTKGVQEYKKKGTGKKAHWVRQDLSLAEQAVVDTQDTKDNPTIVREGSEDRVFAAVSKAWTALPKTYEARTIILPKVKPNSLVHVSTDEVDGIFVVDNMTIQGGNTVDSSFEMALALAEE